MKKGEGPLRDFVADISHGDSQPVKEITAHDGINEVYKEPDEQNPLVPYDQMDRNRHMVVKGRHESSGGGRRFFTQGHNLPGNVDPFGLMPPEPPLMDNNRRSEWGSNGRDKYVIDDIGSDVEGT